MTRAELPPRVELCPSLPCQNPTFADSEECLESGAKPMSTVGVEQSLRREALRRPVNGLDHSWKRVEGSVRRVSPSKSRAQPRAGQNGTNIGVRRRYSAYGAPSSSPRNRSSSRALSQKPKAISKAPAKLAAMPIRTP